MFLLIPELENIVYQYLDLFSLLTLRNYLQIYNNVQPLVVVDYNIYQFLSFHGNSSNNIVSSIYHTNYTPKGNLIPKLFTQCMTGNNVFLPVRCKEKYVHKDNIANVIYTTTVNSKLQRTGVGIGTDTDIQTPVIMENIEIINVSNSNIGPEIQKTNSFEFNFIFNSKLKQYVGFKYSNFSEHNECPNCSEINASDSWELGNVLWDCTTGYIYDGKGFGYPILEALDNNFAETFDGRVFTVSYNFCKSLFTISCERLYDGGDRLIKHFNIHHISPYDIQAIVILKEDAI